MASPAKIIIILAFHEAPNLYLPQRPGRLDWTTKAPRQGWVLRNYPKMFIHNSMLSLLLAAAVSVSAGLAWSTADAEGAHSVRAGRFTFVFATEQQGRTALATADRYTDAMSPFDRKVRMRTSEDRGEQAFLEFAGDAARDWPAGDQEAVTAAIRKIERSLKKVQSPKTAEVLLIRTSGEEEAGAAYTRGTAIVVPTDKSGSSKVPLGRLIAHELFHVISRNDPDLRDQLYQRIGFRRTGSISLPADLAPLKITNPDAPEIDQVIDLRLDRDRSITVTPVLYAKRPFDPRNSGSVFGYLEFRLMEVIEMVGKRYIANIVDGKPVMHEPNIPDFRRQIGRNTSYIIHPEEILAENFAFVVTERPGVPDKWLVEAIRDAMFDDSKSQD